MTFVVALIDGVDHHSGGGVENGHNISCRRVLQRRSVLTCLLSALDSQAYSDSRCYTVLSSLMIAE